MLRTIINSIRTALASAMRAVGGFVSTPAQAIWTRCRDTGRWLRETIPGVDRFASAYGQIFRADLEDMPALPALAGAFGGLAIAGAAGLAGIPAAAVIAASAAGAHVGRQAILAGVATSVGAAADSRLGRRAAAGARGAASGASGLVADLVPAAVHSFGRGVGGIGRGISRTADAGLSAVGAVARIPSRILGGLLGGGGGAPVAPGADAYEQQQADAAPGRNAAPAKRTAQMDRQVAAAVRDAAATRADAIDEARPEAGHERDRGLPAQVIGWLDRLSPDELRVVARLPSEAIGALVAGGQVIGVRPLSTKELGTDCISVWTAQALAQEVNQHEALRQAMGRAPAAVPVAAGPDADMQVLHELDQRYREQLRPARPSSIAARIQAAASRREERERTSAPVGGLTVH